jgi:hypothetical protein
MWNGDNGFSFCGTVLRNYVPSHLDTDMRPAFRDYNQQTANPFRSTYVYEHVSSKMKVVKGEYRIRLQDEIFEICI